MKNFVIGAVVGAVAGAGVGYAVWGQPVARDERARAATITVTGAAGSQCAATVDQAVVANKKGKRVLFAVDSEDALCGSGNWKIELRFLNIPASGSTGEIVYNATPNPLAIDADGLSRPKLRNDSNLGTFKYEVWFVPSGSGDPYKMIDPELIIEM